MVKMSTQTETAQPITVIEYIHGQAIRISGYVFALVLLSVGLLFIIQNIWLAIPALISVYLFGMLGTVVLASGFVKRQVEKATAEASDG